MSLLKLVAVKLAPQLQRDPLGQRSQSATDPYLQSFLERYWFCGRDQHWCRFIWVWRTRLQNPSVGAKLAAFPTLVRDQLVLCRFVRLEFAARVAAEVQRFH